MALFTFEDLEFMENEGRGLFGRTQPLEEPSSKSLNHILSYSKALSVRPSKLIGQVSTLLN